MKREEKIEVMFESILVELEKLSKAKPSSDAESKDKSISDPIQESVSDEMLDLLKSINDRMRNLDLNAEYFESLESRIEDLPSRLHPQNTITQSKKDHHHYFWFFPDLKGWLTLIKKGKVTWVLGILLIASLSVNYYLGKDYNSLKEQDQKYNYLKFSNDKVSPTELDSLWEIKSYREEKLALIEEAEKKQMNATNE